MTVSGGDDEQRVGDLTATLIMVDDAGHVLIVSYDEGSRFFERTINILRLWTSCSRQHRG